MTTAMTHAETEPDDIGYIATLDERERRELDAADAAIDVAILLHRARTRRGLSQADAARLTGWREQAISRLEQPGANPRLETIQAYLAALFNPASTASEAATAR